MSKTVVAYLAGIGSLMAMLFVGFIAGLTLTGSGSEKIGPTRLDRAHSSDRTAMIDPSSLRSIPQTVEVQSPTTENAKVAEDAKVKPQDVAQQPGSDNLATTSNDSKVGVGVPNVPTDLNSASSSKSTLATNQVTKADTNTSRNLTPPLPAERTASFIAINETPSKSNGPVNQVKDSSLKTQKPNRLEKMILRTIEYPDGRRITQLLPFTRKREAKLAAD